MITLQVVAFLFCVLVCGNRYDVVVLFGWCVFELRRVSKARLGCSLIVWRVGFVVAKIQKVPYSRF